VYNKGIEVEETKMRKFKIVKMDQFEYRLEAKGSGIGSGIAWTWIGNFRNRGYAEKMKKALKEN